MGELNQKETGQGADFEDGPGRSGRIKPEAPTAAPGAKEAATTPHLLMSSGDCSCGWQAGVLLSHDQAVTAWEAHRAEQVSSFHETVKPALDAGKAAPDNLTDSPVSAPCPSCGNPGGAHECAEILRDLTLPKPALGTGNVAPGAKAEVSRFDPARALAKHWMTEMACDHGDQKDQSICACGWLSGWQHNVGEAALAWAEHALGEIPAPAISLPPISLEARELAPATAPITYSEGKKIYDQGWNDGIDHLQKLLMLAVEQRLGR